MDTCTTILLDAKFMKSNGKKHHFRMRGFDPTKPAEKVKAALKKLTKLDIFEKDGVGLYKEVLEAKMVEVKKTVLFKDHQKDKPKKEEKDLYTQITEMAAAMGYSLDASFDILDTLKLPEELTVMEERPNAETLIQLIQLPSGFDPTELSEQQNYRVVASCLPKYATLKDIYLDDETTPAKLLAVSTIEVEKEDTSSAASKALAAIKLPEDLTIIEERPNPETLIQKIGLPKRIDPVALSDKDNYRIAVSCLPENRILEELLIDDETTPARLHSVSRAANTAPPIPLIENASAKPKESIEPSPVSASPPKRTAGESPPKPLKITSHKRRHRLIERIRSRE